MEESDAGSIAGHFRYQSDGSAKGAADAATHHFRSDANDDDDNEDTQSAGSKRPQSK